MVSIIMAKSQSIMIMDLIGYKFIVVSVDWLLMKRLVIPFKYQLMEAVSVSLREIDYPRPNRVRISSNPIRIGNNMNQTSHSSLNNAN